MGTLSHYKDIVDKEKHYALEIINDKEEVDRLFERIQKTEKSIWRGLSQSKYKHYTSLQRFWIENDLHTANYDVESYLKHILQKARTWQNECIPRYLLNFKQEFPVFAALSILRHHDTPTPLIDWSTDPMVGLFFAAFSSGQTPSDTTIDNYFSLYELKENHPFNAFNNKKIQKELIARSESNLRELNKDNGGLEENFLNNFTEAYINQEKLFFERFKDSPIAKIQDESNDDISYYVNNNLNIVNQKGLFLINCHINLPLSEALIERVRNGALEKRMPERQIADSLDNHRKSFISYDIHKSLGPYILKKLNEGGYTSEYIYPDLKKMGKESVESFLSQR